MTFARDDRAGIAACSGVPHSTRASPAQFQSRRRSDRCRVVKVSPMNTSRLLLAGAASAVAVAAASPAAAQAYYLQEQSARAAGRAYSGEAADTGRGT